MAAVCPQENIGTRKEGLKVVPETPGPVHDPPAGEATVKIIISALTQILVLEPASTVGMFLMTTFFVAEFEHPFALTKV